MTPLKYIELFFSAHCFAADYFIMRMYHTLFERSFIDGFLGSLLVSPVHLWDSSLGLVVPGLNSQCMWNFPKYCQFFSRWIASFSFLTSNIEMPYPYSLANRVCCQILRFLANPIGEKWLLNVFWFKFVTGQVSRKQTLIWSKWCWAKGEVKIWCAWTRALSRSQREFQSWG